MKPAEMNLMQIEDRLEEINVAKRRNDLAAQRLRLELAEIEAEEAELELVRHRIRVVTGET